MLARCHDIGHYMLSKGHEIAVAGGVSPNGQQITVILAIGGAAEIALDVGSRLVKEVAKQRDAEDDVAQRN